MQNACLDWHSSSHSGDRRRQARSGREWVTHSRKGARQLGNSSLFVVSPRFDYRTYSLFVAVELSASVSAFSLSFEDRSAGRRVATGRNKRVRHTGPSVWTGVSADFLWRHARVVWKSSFVRIDFRRWDNLSGRNCFIARGRSRLRRRRRLHNIGGEALLAAVGRLPAEEQPHRLREHH